MGERLQNILKEKRDREEYCIELAKRQLRLMVLKHFQSVGPWVRLTREMIVAGMVNGKFSPAQWETLNQKVRYNDPQWLKKTIGECVSQYAYERYLALKVVARPAI